MTTITAENVKPGTLILLDGQRVRFVLVAVVGDPGYIIRYKLDDRGNFIPDHATGEFLTESVAGRVEAFYNVNPWLL